MNGSLITERTFKLKAEKYGKGIHPKNEFCGRDGKKIGGKFGLKMA